MTDPYTVHVIGAVIWTDCGDSRIEVGRRDYVYGLPQADAHLLAYWEELIDRTEAESVAHILGTYY